MSTRERGRKIKREIERGRDNELERERYRERGREREFVCVRVGGGELR